MPTYDVKLIKRETIAEGTMAFHFEKPRGFRYQAGQCADWTLINPPESDAEGDTRTFTLASAPYEADLMVATRMRSTAFKRVLNSMPLGTAVTLDGPFGDLVLHEDAARPAVFLMGGIGITPARSIILQALRDGLPHRLFLFYGNRTPAGAAFLKEMQGLAKKHPQFRFIGTMSDAGGASTGWHGETGYIDAALLSKELPDLRAPVYYIAGPPAMVASLKHVVAGSGVEPTQIRSEEFSGY